MVYGLGTIVPRLLNYILLTPFYTRIFFQPEVYGIITEIYAYVAFLMVLLTYGMETTYFRFASNSKNPQNVFNNAFTSILITSALFLILVFTNISSISDLLGYANYPNFIKWFTLIVVLDAITAIPFAKLRQENKAFKFSIIKFGNVLINIGFNVFFLIICRNSDNDFLNSLYNPAIGVGYAFISNLFASIFSFIFILSEFKHFKFSLNIGLLKQMFNYSFPLLIVGIAGIANEHIDKILLKYLVPENSNPMFQLGIYGANYKLAVLMTIFIQMFRYAAEPFFFKQADKIDAKEIYSKLMTYFIIFCLFIFLLVTLYIDIFKYFIHHNYYEGLRIVPIVLLANMFLGIYFNLSVWYKINNLTKFGAYISLVGLFITLAINYLLIPIIGYMASAIATISCYFIMMMISFTLGKKYYPISYSIKNIFYYILIAILLFIIFQFIHLNNFFTFIVASLFLIIFILCVCYFEKIRIHHLKNLLKFS